MFSRRPPIRVRPVSENGWKNRRQKISFTQIRQEVEAVSDIAFILKEEHERSSSVISARRYVKSAESN